MLFLTQSLVVLATTILWVTAVLLLARRMRRARDVPAQTGPWPMVSIVVAAMNEEENIEPAMRSLLAMDYPGFEIIAVDDRSTDATGAILDRLATEFPGRLDVIHIDHLPPGWLGKCNALAQGTKRVRGEWILFTDADVLFEPEALRVAMAFVLANHSDHAVLFPQMLWKGYVEAALLAFFSMAITIGFRLWALETRARRAFIGVGAFNLVRHSLYERFGGHEPLRLEVADDMKLGYLAKKHGGRSIAIRSEGLVRVRWRMGTRDTVRGLERSGFAGLDFSVVRTLGSVIACFIGLLAPYWLPFVAGSAAVTWISIASIVLIIAAYGLNTRIQHYPWWMGVLHPVACVIFSYAMARSAIVTLMRGGLSWRGTFYSIAELKKGTVR